MTQQQPYYPGQADVLPEQRKGRREDAGEAPSTQTAPEAAPAAPSGHAGRWVKALVALVCAAVILLAHTELLSLALLLVLLGLCIVAIRSVVRTAGPKPPLPPTPETVQPVVIGPPPPARTLALATSCFWCHRPLTDLESRQFGVDPNCRTRRGPHQTYAVNPHYIAWGNALHALRIQQESERPAIAARNAQASAVHHEAVAAWEVARNNPHGIAQQASKKRAMLLAVFTLACTLVAVGGVI